MSRLRRVENREERMEEVIPEWNGRDDSRVEWVEVIPELNG